MPRLFLSTPPQALKLSSSQALKLSSSHASLLRRPQRPKAAMTTVVRAEQGV